MTGFSTTKTRGASCKSKFKYELAMVIHRAIEKSESTNF
uniref:Uncharacterized protein n=1 Tax=Arundo donax TaxID=35708 RepID=A0A0A8Y9H5_ARUDO